MIAKTTKTMLIMTLFSLVGLAIPAGVSQTAFAQSVVEEAVGDTVLDGFFDDNTNEEGATDTESQELAQQQDQDQDQDADQQQDQEISQDETATQGNNAEAGDNTGTIGQNIEGNEVEGADCGDALICFGNDIVNDAEQDQDASVHDVSEANTATFGADDADNIGIQDQDQDQDQDADQRAANFRLDFEFNEECLAEATGGDATADTDGDAEPLLIDIEVAEAAGGSATAVQDCLFGESSQSETSEETTTEAPSNSILELGGI